MNRIQKMIHLDIKLALLEKYKEGVYIKILKKLHNEEKTSALLKSYLSEYEKKISNEYRGTQTQEVIENTKRFIRYIEGSLAEHQKLQERTKKETQIISEDLKKTKAQRKLIENIIKKHKK